MPPGFHGRFSGYAVQWLYNLVQSEESFVSSRQVNAMAVPKQRTTETMSVSESRKQYSEILNRVYRDEEQVVIEKNGIPVAAIVPISVVRDAEMTAERRAQALASLRQVQQAFAGIPEDELERELDKALAEAKEIQLEKRAADRPSDRTS